MSNRPSLKLSPTHVIGGPPREVAPPSPFEPGQRVGHTAPGTAGPALDSPPGVDHFAAVEARRLEMLDEIHGKQNQLRARAAELRQQAKALHLETDEKARTSNDIHGIEDDRRRVQRLLEDERRILNIELPALQAERVSICGGSHPTIVHLTIGAQGRIASDLAAKLDKAASDHETARRAFDEHLAKLATTETLVLAHSLVHAARVAKVKVPEIVHNLLAAHGPSEAA